MTYVKNSLKRTWITEGIDIGAIYWAKGLGVFLAQKGGKYKEGSRERDSRANPLSTTQLRKFFGQIKRLQAEGYSEANHSKLLMLIAQLAYAVGRNKVRRGRDVVDTTKIGFFQEELETAIEQIKNPQHFKNFVNLVEAIVAYHKFEGGQ